MARTNNDTWDLASNVGASATMAAAARAVATRSANPLIDDPFAEPLVRAVGIDFSSPARPAVSLIGCRPTLKPTTTIPVNPTPPDQTPPHSAMSDFLIG
jgi:O-methyltransferase involved in polyketide biosynthesis